ncbi:membrane protein PM19L [Physcomitrium patens]|uniref:Uncharacterized protein n=1 Tax=Physcomitrium patens TaxID=3218 RepID=A9TQE2_PHYPA|nr:membrane protein PM19L-like [Physcomitrium patens]PNR54822.1 hypothetical protein PHYPA_005715 [Physcomitrium patens]|eukprot:XP_024372469.1 membrane protein PM19L-like [Physcomitrella patens]
MAIGIGRSLSAPLLVINFMLYLVSACLAGWALNRNLGATIGIGAGPIGNIVTPTFLPLALIASMVGLASVFAGINHLRVFRSDSLSSAASTSLIAWLLTLLAMGVACKEIHTGGSNRQKRIRALEAFIIILALFELLYLLSLQAGLFGTSDGGYDETRSANAKTSTTYGTPTAAAV